MREPAVRALPDWGGSGRNEWDHRVSGGPWTIAEVNAWDRDAFVARLGFLFEGSPWIVEAVWPGRPFATRDDLHRALCDVVARAGAERQLALIRAHPDLVGRAALSGTLTRESTGEQAAAGIDPGRLTPAEIARFAELNAAYKARFGFPFVICARENTKERILAGFAARLSNSDDDEVATALAEIEKICWYRLADVVAERR
jgi:OHCU decarboxylase